ncbi:DUF2793 domain-containing protein [Brevundimonas variabilis]|uniref:Glycine-rich domain-containing protein n=1 Tax=Brevundimonas variabilis TaxID=74312 RepID=A0A7W9CJ80_9CAUL|nr:DUF2793 domain-containing protein [Brevundimonas variabilis]MBB5746451.1 hypothetical protein [Brevundimonas variabilis]
MSTQASSRLNLPYLAAGQLQKHVTLNEALTRLDALVQTTVVTRTLKAQPARPTEGHLYILPEGATGADWSSRKAGDLVRAGGGGWTLVPPVEGMIVLVLVPPAALVHRGGRWTPLPVDKADVAQNLTRLGVNTEADSGNPFAARLNDALWTAIDSASGGNGDLRIAWNKEGVGDTLSFLFQSGYSGRAEFGLLGDDSFRLKVSPDGLHWHEALAVDPATGAVRFERGATRVETTTLKASERVTLPPWARRLEVLAVGGGGGGGAGAASSSGIRFGGGGGGAGGVSTAHWDLTSLAGPLTVTIGPGGTGGSVVGADGGDGTSTTVASGGVVLLTAHGGLGGSGGTAAGGPGGAGGRGTMLANGGGGSSVATTASAGHSLICPVGPGGGGGGGGLDGAATARSGGPGGAGSVLGRSASGGGGGTGAPGAAGGGAPDLGLGASGGGGGGGANAYGPGHAGGDGTTGSGGGGGGAGTTVPGPGGRGGAGFVRITAFG